MFDDLISYDGILEASEDTFGFEDVTFLRDFGPYKTGDIVSSLWFNLPDSKVESFNAEDNIENTWKFKIVTA